MVLIAVAGRSNGLGPVLSGNTSLPVINCPPVKPENIAQDLLSSINVPSGKILTISNCKLILLVFAARALSNTFCCQESDVPQLFILKVQH